MKKKHLQPLIPAALYARVSSDRHDVDLSVSAQLRALEDYARANGYSVAREYVDEAESGRVADRPQFREMIEEGSKSQAPFDVILVWKFSRFTRKREHAVAFTSMLRRKGIRVVSITEQADDTATGRLLEGIIESVDEFYSEGVADAARPPNGRGGRRLPVRHLDVSRYWFAPVMRGVPRQGDDSAPLLPLHDGRRPGSVRRRVRPCDANMGCRGPLAGCNV